jgi:acetate kinase
VPYDLYEKYGIRKYGFHGTSHKFVSIEAAKMMGKDIKSLKIITCHLGNGASVCAIDGGKSVDTSMGFTPLAGLCMGTRCGDIDPAVIPFLVKSVGMSIDEVDTLMNKKSGVLGVSGVSSDFRDVLAEEAKGNKRAELALNVYTYRVKSVIGSYIAALNGVDCIVFTAGSGENSEPLRRRICAGLSNLGIVLDKERNNVMGKPAQISSDDSKVKVFAIPTNEELMIARDTKEIVEGR